MNSLTQSPQERSTATKLSPKLQQYVDRFDPVKNKYVHIYTIIVASIAVDGENEPEDSFALTAYFKEYPFDKEIDEWVDKLLEGRYRVVEKFEVERKKLNPDNHLFETVWEPPMISDAIDEI